MKKPRLPRPPKTRETEGPAGELVLYQTEDGRTRVECRFENETIWLTQALIADLFQVAVVTVNEHLSGIYADNEVERAATIRKFRIVRSEGNRTVSRDIEHYNLAAILGVGYRVRSDRGVAFRQWATARLSEYLVKGFVMDDERLKNPDPNRIDYFDEVLERIRDIRSSEKRMYLKVKDIFTLAADYRGDRALTHEFFRVIQNKLHWAATGHTAAELIAARADPAKPNMGLNAWKGTKVRKADVTVAKNYLRENEIQELNRIVTMYLDFAEDQARRRRVLYMKDWRERLDSFLKFNERDILDHPGKVSKEVADGLAEDQYDKFHARRLATDAKADEDSFDEVVRRLPPGPGAPRPASPKPAPLKDEEKK